MVKYPPKDISPQELWSKIIELPRPTKIINFPRKNENGEFDCQLKLMILTFEDFINSRLNIEKYISSKINELNIDSSELNTIKNTLNQSRYISEILFKTCRDIDDISKPFFPNLDLVDKLISPEESIILFSEFAEFQSKFAPIGLNQDENVAWIDKLIIGGSYSMKFFIIGSCENIKDVYDVPLCQLTEGQILAWVAARKYIKEQE